MKSSQELISKIYEEITKKVNQGDDSTVYKRLADVEARMVKLERLLIKHTPTGNEKLNEHGKEVAKLWYKELEKKEH